MQELFERSDEELFFEFLIIEGLKRIGRINDKRYVARAKFEFDRMIKKGYVKYFLASWEYVNFCRRNNIFVGAGRGSAAASLISHCLNLTEADPIKYGLLFERYLSEKRSDSPDFDSDFEDMEREKIFEHLINRYGKEHAVKIATYSRFHPKGILRDLGRIFNVPGWEINKVCSLVLERSGGDARCVAGDSKVYSEGKILTMSEIVKYKAHKSIVCFNEATGKLEEKKILNKYKNGKQKVFEIETIDGKKIKVTENHRFLTKEGWRRLKDLNEKVYIAIIS